MSRLYDVTIPLSSATPVWPGDPPVAYSLAQRVIDGQPANVGVLSLSCHAGTHVDAPYHILVDGTTVDQLPLEILLGKARVVEVEARDGVGRETLEALDLRDDLRLLVKTRLSGHRTVQPDSAYLTPDAASYLAQAGLKLIGIDSLSIDPASSVELPAHHVLLSAGVVVVEGLDLTEVEPGEYEMACLPLRLLGGDGAPARVVLRTRM